MSSANSAVPGKSSPRPSAPAPGAQLLFYQKPEALTVERHGNLWLKRSGDYAFAQATNSVGITGTEFVQAMRFYPIVFSAETPYPVAILGLSDRNLFVEANGLWRGGHYVPAYMRRYPFVFIAHPDRQQFILGIDRGCGRLVEEGDPETARPLYEEGEPAPATKEALTFCQAYQADHGFTQAFAWALAEQGLLIDNRALAKLSDGRQMNLQGFKVIDREKFAKLPDAVIAAWHKKGWLVLAHFHLASLERFQHLLELQGTPKATGQGG